MSNECFNLKAHCVVLGTDIRNNKKYIASTLPEDIKFPCLNLDAKSIETLNSTLIYFLQNKIKYASEIELIPQIINLHSKDIVNEEDKQNNLNIIFGFVVDYQPNLQDCYWVEFNDLQPVQYSNLIFEVIQKLY
jgi:hypothetical protein